VLLSISAVLALYLVGRTPGATGDRLVLFAIAAGLAFGITGFLARDTWHSLNHSRVLVRNFYGALVVYDSSTDGDMGPVRILRHGTIDHGEQFLWPQNRRFPTTYYAKKSGIGLAIQTVQMQGPMTVGVIGLGAGTLATYGRPIDHYRIYDINPLVLKIAQTEFTYLLNCYARHEVIMGDARLSMEREPSQKFDVLAVDAFSGDAIPVHLLTREAYKLYWRHLKPDGVLAVHVSNRYLTLAPVVALAAAESGKIAKMVSFETDDRNATEETDSDWVLVTSRPGFFDQPELKVAKPIDPIPGLRMWTDDYSNLYRILR
jgi:SAM-dependent methyltransferase